MKKDYTIHTSLSIFTTGLEAEVLLLPDKFSFVFLPTSSMYLSLRTWDMASLQSSNLCLTFRGREGGRGKGWKRERWGEREREREREREMINNHIIVQPGNRKLNNDLSTDTYYDKQEHIQYTLYWLNTATTHLSHVDFLLSLQYLYEVRELR